MKIPHLSLSLITLLIITVAVIAQDTPPAGGPVNWQRLQSPSGEISVEMPEKQTYFYDEGGFAITQTGLRLPTEQPKLVNFSKMHLLNSAAGRTVMSLEIYEPSSGAALSELMTKDKLNGQKTKEKISGFESVQIELKKLETYQFGEIEISHISRYIATKKYLYVISVSNRGPQSDESKKFLASVKLNPTKSPADGRAVVDISTLKPFGVNDIGLNLNTKLGDEPPVKPQAIGAAPDPNGVIIITRPVPSYPPSDRKNGETGSVRMKLNMAENGRIAGITFLSVLPPAMNRISFFSALRVKFIPAEKDGRFIPVAKTVAYSFNIF